MWRNLAPEGLPPALLQPRLVIGGDATNEPGRLSSGAVSENPVAGAHVFASVPGRKVDVGDGIAYLRKQLCFATGGLVDRSPRAN
jgi:hypothetical protein